MLSINPIEKWSQIPETYLSILKIFTMTLSILDFLKHSLLTSLSRCFTSNTDHFSHAKTNPIKKALPFVSLKFTQFSRMLWIDLSTYVMVKLVQKY